MAVNPENLPENLVFPIPGDEFVRLRYCIHTTLIFCTRRGNARVFPRVPKPEGTGT